MQTIKKLLKKYKKLDIIYELKKEELLKIDGIGEKISEIILAKEYRKNLEKYMEYMRKEKISLITINDKQYPQKLKKIEDCPMYLYVKGNINLLNQKSIAIVGTRNCTEYGKNVAYDLASKLVKNDIIVVSGLAKGIDSFSHLGALNKKGSTVAVLGCRIDRTYPKENENLAQDIINNGGAIISEYVMGQAIEKMNFPARNRIISGLSNRSFSSRST